MGENYSNETGNNGGVRVHEVSKLEAGALLGLAAYGGVSLIKSAVRKAQEAKMKHELQKELMAEALAARSSGKKEEAHSKK